MAALSSSARDDLDHSAQAEQGIKSILASLVGTESIRDQSGDRLRQVDLGPRCPAEDGVRPGYPVFLARLTLAGAENDADVAVGFSGVGLSQDEARFLT